MEKGHIFKRAEFIGSVFRILDIIIIAISGVAVYRVQLGEWVLPGNYQLFLVALALLTINTFTWFSVYRGWRGQSLYKELLQVSVAWIVVVLAIGALAFLTKTGQDYSRLWAGWTFIISYLGLTAYRITLSIAIRYTRTVGLNQKQVIIIGAGALGQRACSAMLRESWAGLVPIAIFDDDQALIGQNYNGIQIVGGIDQVVPFIEAHRRGDDTHRGTITQVWVALPLSEQKRIEELQLALLNTAANVYFIPDLFGFNLANYSVDEMIGLPVMNMSATSMSGGNAIAKRIEDIVLSSLMLIALSPLMLIISILIKRESPGPIFFKQRRYGQDGKEILVWKFRSMTVTEDGEKVTQASRGDERVTKTGSWLRKLSLDELPQLFNVIEGSMSLVGPRPHAVAHNEFYRTKVQGYMSRHQIRPGITGWAQVNGCRGETADLEDMEERIRYDLEYIRTWSISLDVRILLRTIITVINYKDTY